MPETPQIHEEEIEAQCPEITEADVLLALKIEELDENAKEVLSRWLKQEEEKIEASFRDEAYEYAKIDLTIRLARLYYESSYYVAAKDSFEAARYEAEGFRLDELAQAISNEEDEKQI
ncbi:MAG: hypothetical protein UR28_C0020G0020 [Candidatus Peregrinibacteria bacterium GW2011_GWF2_33_10]|nr:MAG: hypothetical protein UR28_C0020G0020 [Candidatus Peregrinibacteria bacterium GW2011_GWF2_33_10]OGJ45323.1 MAG: hypothetical protein A2272_06230 [Candidatus Peregrinibacteria bacterium RIFOXYA12_FULL_33_12]OGJ45385.1 MAG: hypothetical protein A2263_03910 [Candidatus Peregrinibacteria bacterium RIFOXYA2_FULL_33_21]OGJ50988.1 MAG: hypothetical protein A2307_05505 [Candidatus Peregrinibacteria bacterium RIFOXYB2_FULL_33_20]